MRIAGATYVVILAVLMWVVLGVLNIKLADLNQDEGWYLYAARRVAAGSLPYRDFAYTQGPVMPIVYAMFDPLVAAKGVEAGRWCTFLLGGLALVGAAGLAGRVGPRGGGAAAVIALGLVGVNVYHSQFTAIVKTYSLCSVFLVYGLLAVVEACRRPRPVVGIVGGVLLSLAAGTRLSAGMALPVVCLFVLAHPACRPSRAWLYVGLGGAFGLATIFVPFLATAPEGLAFGLLEYHSGRDPGGPLSMLVYKAGFVSRFVGFYYVAAVLTVLLGLLHLIRPGRAGASEAEKPSHAVAMLWSVALAISAVHLAAPFPYDDYQVIVFPVFGAAIAAGLVRGVARYSLENRPETAGTDPWLTWATWGILLACIGAAFSSPVNQAWVVRERDRIWWRLKEGTSLRVLQEAGAYVRDRTKEGDLVLTQDIYLAVEAGREVPAGMDMGPFCFFPEMSTLRAEKIHVLNKERMAGVLEDAPAPIAAISGYGLAIRSPGVSELGNAEQAELRGMLDRRYDVIHSFPHFGQGHTRLDIYRRKPEADPAS